MRRGYIITTLSLHSKACNCDMPLLQGAGIRWQGYVHYLWDAEGVLLIDLMPHKDTVTEVY